MRLIDIESESFLNEMREKQNACKEIIQSSDGETLTWTERDHWEGVYGIFVEMALTLKKQPAVDAAPVVHGKWTTKRTQKHDGEWYCTVCDYEPIVMSDDMKYCPGCGAKMDLEGTA